MTTHRATGLEHVTAVRVIPPYSLEVTFDDGMVRRIDLTNELWGEVFEPLKDPEFFAKVQVDKDAHTVIWPNGADLAPEFLYNSGKLVAPARV